MSDDRCGVILVFEGSGFDHPCVLDRGHEGMHRDRDGDQWTVRFPGEKPQFSTGYVQGALDALRGRVERLEEVSEPMAPLHRILNTVERLTDTLEQRIPLPAPEPDETPKVSVKTCQALWAPNPKETYECMRLDGHGGLHLDDQLNRMWRSSYGDPGQLMWSVNL